MCGFVQGTNESVYAFGGHLKNQKKVGLKVVNEDSGLPVGAPDSKNTKIQGKKKPQKLAHVQAVRIKASQLTKKELMKTKIRRFQI